MKKVKKMVNSITAIKALHLIAVNLMSISVAWWMDIDLENLEWVKWPSTMGFGTFLYLIYNFYNSKRSKDKVDFDSVTGQLNQIVSMQRAEIVELKKELQEKENMINKLQYDRLEVIKNQENR